MPARYIQSIYKQYTLFIKDQQAQQSAAAEDMIEELEDGGGMMGAPSAKKQNPNQPQLTPREEQLRAIHQNIQNGMIDNPPEAPE